MFTGLHKALFLENAARTVLLPVDCVLPSPWQPRRQFEAGALDNLADSIRQHGLLQPIAVRVLGGGRYELIAGERRLRAVRMIGESHIRATLLSIDDRDAALLTMSENLQREDLTFFEEAEGYRRLIDGLKLTQQELATRLGCQQSTIANKLRLLRLPEDVRAKLIQHNLTERHARALLKLHDEDQQISVLDTVVLKALNVRQTEELVEKRLQRMLSREKEPLHGTQRFSRAWRDWRLFANSMRTAVGELKSSGLDAQFTLHDADGFVEMRVVVPKSRAGVALSSTK